MPTELQAETPARIRAGRVPQDVTMTVHRVLDLRTDISPARAVLVGVSGIDASGKGFLSRLIVGELETRRLRVALINADGWLNLLHVRFGMDHPGEHFYAHGLRLDEMFRRLVLPLRDHRSVDIEMDYTEETAREHRRHRYGFRDVEVVLVEGIFLFKRQFRPHFDLACWVDCSFATALQRAIQRGQEGLPPDETIRAFETIYWPAQRLHFERDRPRKMAGLIIMNDDAPKK